MFIPAHTWVSIKNSGTEPASTVSIFSAPGSKITCDVSQRRRAKNRHLFLEHKRMSVIGWGRCIQRSRRKGPRFRNLDQGRCKGTVAGKK